MIQLFSRTTSVFLLTTVKGRPVSEQFSIDGIESRDKKFLSTQLALPNLSAKFHLRLCGRINVICFKLFFSLHNYDFVSMLSVNYRFQNPNLCFPFNH
jgi:hypothetical protein